jgi:uncharacterized protein
MILSLVRLPPDGMVFEHRYEMGELDLSAYDFALSAQPSVSGRVDKVGLSMRVRGSITCTVSRPCDRCLAEVTLPLLIDFDLLYAPVELSPARTGEVEIAEEDLDLAFFEKDQIDLGALVLEQIELHLPIRVLCQESCRGLCSQCGVDRNVESCHCPPIVDPRWESLFEETSPEESLDQITDEATGETQNRRPR